jgi:hypothetical protein
MDELKRQDQAAGTAAEAAAAEDPNPTTQSQHKNNLYRHLNTRYTTHNH